MSLISASGIISGLKEYVYRGIQQLPIVLASTSLVLGITTGSIAHNILFLGMLLLIPACTLLLQLVGGYLKLNRATGDTCDLATLHHQKDLTLKYFEGTKGEAFAPSYWITSIGFFFGYAFSNISDTFHEKPADGGSEAFTHHTIFIAINTSIFFLLLLFIRLYFMRGCDGTSFFGTLFSLFAGFACATLGWYSYIWSKQCGARSTDLFGIVSQFIPVSAGAPKPVVCTTG
jgi:hypothetical protein